MRHSIPRSDQRLFTRRALSEPVWIRPIVCDDGGYDGNVAMMGAPVALQDGVKPVTLSLLDSGLEATALHD